MSNPTKQNETELDRYIRSVSDQLGYEGLPPTNIRYLLQNLKKQGYSEGGAARHIKTFLDIQS